MKGDPTLCKVEVSTKLLSRSDKRGKKALQWSVSHKLAEGNGFPITVRDVLEEFMVVFQEKLGPLPKWAHDHAISLKEGATIPNLRPYRYLHFRNMKLRSWLLIC